VDKLVGAAEIANRFGVRRSQVIHVWRQRHRDFPAPIVGHLTVGLLWYWPDVERWGRKTGRLGPTSRTRAGEAPEPT
jgi:hypothetical protein